MHEHAASRIRTLTPAIRAWDYPSGYEARCEQALEEALDSAVAYAAWRARDPGPATPATMRLAQMPILTKADLRAHGPQAFAPGGRDVARALAEGEVSLAETSGTTGDRVVNVWCQRWWDRSERASWSLNAHARAAGLGDHLEAILTSPYCTGVADEEGYLAIEDRTLGRFLYLTERSDPSSWTAEHMDRMIGEIRSFEPAVLEANPSFLARLARHAAVGGIEVRGLRLIVLTYENPSALHLRAIRRVFDAPVASSYGSTEAGYVLMECEAGSFHQVTEACHVDFLPFREEHGGPAVGRILVTTFANPWRSLIRFDPGDVVRLDGARPCRCGCRGGLVAASVEGRAVNLTAAVDGRAVTQAEVDRALAAVDGLVEYQVIQRKPVDYELRVVAEGRAAGAVRRAASEALHGLYGDGASIECREVRAVRPDPPGKYRLTRALFPMRHDDLLDQRYLPPESP